MIRPFLRIWLPVLLWCAAIFGASSDKSSGEHSSRIIGPIVRFFFPRISENALDHVVHFARKAAHATEYAILALLLWRALHNSRRRPPEKPGMNTVRPWSWRIAFIAFAVAALYAMSDEYHQSFVPSRTAQVVDVFIDVGGAAFALFALWFLGPWRKQRAAG